MLTVVKQNILVVSYVAYMIFIGCLFCPILLPIPDFFTKDSFKGLIQNYYKQYTYPLIIKNSTH